MSGRGDSLGISVVFIYVAVAFGLFMVVWWLAKIRAARRGDETERYDP